MDNIQIASLVQKARAGNGEAMSRLLEEAHGSVLFQCRKIMKHPEDAEDMAQEVVLTIYQNLDKLQAPEKFLGWANRMAAHMCLNQKQRHPKGLQFLEDESGHSILDTMEMPTGRTSHTQLWTTRRPESWWRILLTLCQTPNEPPYTSIIILK